MSKRANMASVGLFVFVIIAMTITLVLYISDRSFSGKEQQRYELLYDSSVKGLNVGAPVTLRGVKIGEVMSVRTKLYGRQRQLLNSVVIAIYLDAIVVEGFDQGHGKLVDELLKNGLAAKLRLQSILTGLLYVEVDMLNNGAKPAQFKTEYPQIPTVPSNLETIVQHVESIDFTKMAQNLSTTLDNLATFTSSDELLHMVTVASSAFKGMEEMSYSMTDSMAGIRTEFESISASMDEVKSLLVNQVPDTTQQLNETMKELQDSLVQLQGTLVVVEDTVASDSPLIYQFEQSLKDFGRTSRAIEDLTKTLEQQPSSFLFGKKEIAQ